LFANSRDPSLSLGAITFDGTVTVMGVVVLDNGTA
jgi:hypothetical protein